MRFRILLVLIYLRLRWLSNNNAKFQRKIAGQDLSISIGFIDDDRGRYFVIKGGSITSSIGTVDSSDLHIRFSSAAYGYTLLTKATKNPMAFAKGMNSRNIQLVGHMHHIFWFAEVSRYLPLRQKKSKNKRSLHNNSSLSSFK
ncbi:hypothetical protein A9Q81_03890 [Gammaproteobacteria bacterium 42_54_T18]|nr:hypothetical protein A9Q81_03890 [Gammaproteobacteria bacterium 42_54_T18]